MPNEKTCSYLTMAETISFFHHTESLTEPTSMGIHSFLR